MRWGRVRRFNAVTVMTWVKLSGVSPCGQRIHDGQSPDPQGGQDCAGASATKAATAIPLRIVNADICAEPIVSRSSVTPAAAGKAQGRRDHTQDAQLPRSQPPTPGVGHSNALQHSELGCAITHRLPHGIRGQEQQCEEDGATIALVMYLMSPTCFILTSAVSFSERVLVRAGSWQTGDRWRRPSRRNDRHPQSER